MERNRYGGRKSPWEREPASRKETVKGERNRQGGTKPSRGNGNVKGVRNLQRGKTLSERLKNAFKYNTVHLQFPSNVCKH